MSHEVLYRKYRPLIFSDVIGQEHVISALEGAIASHAIGHAYLFCGSRGTGKTSIARIFAREIGTSDNDTYEIDAASNRGIDDVRALREAVLTLPFESRYKVYIIDEVHMLTKEAFNALLKTLEEPPKHVVFILATTEMDKLPETIISRCQAFSFRRPTAEILKDVISAVAKKEGLTLAPDAAELIALLGDGSFRDAHGVLEKVMSGAKGKKISREDVELVTGSPRAEIVRAFIEALAKKDAEAAFSAIADLKKHSSDPKLFLDLVTAKSRVILLARIAPAAAKAHLADTSKEDKEFIEKLAKDSTNVVGAGFLRSILSTYDLVGATPISELPLELLVAELTQQK
jgi:DNA polymerase-3 subunit gamma/tau